MKFAGILFLTWVASGQTLTLTGPARVFPGQSALISLELVNVPGVDLAGLQWTLPTGSALPMAQPIIANKSRMCAPSSLTCALFGVLPAPVGGVISPSAVFNALPIASGPVQSFTVPIPTGAHPGDTLMIQVSGVYGASPAGAAVAVSASPVVLTVGDPLDLNMDGVVDRADQQSAMYMWRAAPTLANFLLVAMIAGKLQP